MSHTKNLWLDLFLNQERHASTLQNTQEAAKNAIRLLHKGVSHPLRSYATVRSHRKII